MGYRIVYGGEVQKKAIPRKGSGNLRLLTALFMLVFILSVKIWWNEGAEQLRSILIPGELSATEAAFSGLVSDLREGEGIRESVTAFCQMIIQNAHAG